VRIHVEDKRVTNPDTGVVSPAFACRVYEPSGAEADLVLGLDTDAHTIERHVREPDGTIRQTSAGGTFETETLDVTGAGWTFTFPDDSVRRIV
jgi:hypothetical protein